MQAPTLNPAVQYCLHAYRQAYNQTKSTATAPDYMSNSKIAQAGSIQHQAEKAAEAAWHNAMPTFTDYQSILDYVACVTHAIPLNIIDKDLISKLLYAAQIATGVLREIAKKPADSLTSSREAADSLKATPPPPPIDPPTPTQNTQTTQPTQETTPPPPPPIRTSFQPNNQHQPQTHQPLNQTTKPTQINPKNHPPVHPNQKRIPKNRRQKHWKSIIQYLDQELAK